MLTLYLYDIFRESHVKQLNTLEVVHQSQHTGPADQSEHIALFRRSGFIETGTKQSVTDSCNKPII